MAMKENAQSLSKISSSSNLFNIGKSTATAVFVNNVRPGGLWDFKSQDSWGLVSEQTYRYENMLLEFDDIGNIHYGYVGRALFCEDVLLTAGGMVQIISGTSDFNYWDSNFDDPRDQAMISIGSNLWNKCNPSNSSNNRIGGIIC